MSHKPQPIRSLTVKPYLPILRVLCGINGSWSKNKTDSTTRRPANKPMTMLPNGVTTAHGAVIATKPANAPLMIMVK